MQNSRHIILNHAGLNLQSLVTQAIAEDIDAFVDGNYRATPAGKIVVWAADAIAPATESAHAVPGWKEYRLPNEASAKMRDLMGEISNEAVNVLSNSKTVEPAGSLDLFEGLEFSISSSRFAHGKFGTGALETTKLQIAVKPRFRPEFEHADLAVLSANIGANFLGNIMREDTRLIAGRYALYRGNPLSYFPDYNPANNLNVSYCLVDTDPKPGAEAWPKGGDKLDVRLQDVMAGMESILAQNNILGFEFVLGFADPVKQTGPQLSVIQIDIPTEEAQDTTGAEA